jgi:tetratricopeptide (TPR) repeat protein
MKKYKYFYLTIFLVLCCFAVSCVTRMPALYHENGDPLTIIEYEKIAQKEYDNERYDNAIMAYEAILENYKDNLRASGWANYEIGYCYFVQKEYDTAEIYFRKVLNEYQDPASKKLAQDMLDKIVEEKDKKNKKKKTKQTDSS